MKKLLLTALILAFAGSVYAGPGVNDSSHDIPFKYPASKNVVDEDTELGGNRLCGYCHTPHHADTEGANQTQPLWSRPQTADFAGGTYQNYTSFTLDGGTLVDPGNSTQGVADANIGSSWLCLSCHDGSVAVDQHYDFLDSGLTALKLSGDNYDEFAIGEGGDLRNDHPIGVSMVDARAAEAANGAQTGLNDPASTAFIGNGLLGTFKISNFLYQNEYVTCSSCHDVHNKDSVAGRYMLYSSVVNSDICLSCHNK